MDRHVESSRKRALFIPVAALCLFLAACGGGGGGGGGDYGAARIAGTTVAFATSHSNASLPSRAYQVGAMTELDTERRSSTDDSVSGQEVGFASLSWRAPSQRVDGKTLSVSEIDGYRIYYGTSPGDYDSVLSVDDPYTFTLRIDDLPAGTYYFAMTTVDTNGLESDYSAETVRTVVS
jgi:hypothetical protein